MLMNCWHTSRLEEQNDWDRKSLSNLELPRILPLTVGDCNQSTACLSSGSAVWWGGFTSALRALCSSILICTAQVCIDFIVYNLSMYKHHHFSLIWWRPIYDSHGVNWPRTEHWRAKSGEGWPIVLFFLRETTVHGAWNYKGALKKCCVNEEPKFLSAI